MVKVLNDSFGIEYGLMSTIHSYTNDQAILDQRHSDLRRARAAAENIIPTSTGAARAVGLVLPELNGKLNGVAFRVPTATGSITDFTAMVSKDVTIEEINGAYVKASEGRMSGILEFSDEPLVSSDYKGNPHSCIIDGLSTMVMEKRMVKVMGWYDNEWGYSCRTADLAAYPSYYEGQGLIPLEAMASGTPVVTVDHGPLPEMVDASVGRLYTLGKVESLAQAIIAELPSSETMARKAKAGPERFPSRFTFHPNADDFAEPYPRSISSQIAP